MEQLVLFFTKIYANWFLLLCIVCKAPNNEATRSFDGFCPMAQSITTLSLLFTTYKLPSNVTFTRLVCTFGEDMLLPSLGVTTRTKSIIFNFYGIIQRKFFSTFKWQVMCSHLTTIPHHPRLHEFPMPCYILETWQIILVK